MRPGADKPGGLLATRKHLTREPEEIMKKTLPIVAVVVVLAVVAIVLTKQQAEPLGKTPTPQAGTPSTGNPDIPPVTAVPTPTPKPKVIESYTSNLATRNMVVLDILPRNVDSMFAPVAAYYQRVAETKLWKRYKPDEAIRAEAAKRADGNPFLATIGGNGPNSIPPEVKEFWTSLSEAAIAFSTKTIAFEADGKKMNIPPFAAVAKFASTESAKKYFDLLNAQLEPYRSKAAADGIVITTPAPGKIEFVGTPPGTDRHYSALLSQDGPQLLVLIGSKEPKDFFEEPGAPTSEAQELVAKSWLPKTAFAASFQMDAVFSLVEDYVASVAGTPEPEEAKKLFEVYKGMKLTTMSLSAENGALRQAACMKMVPGSTIDKMYSTMASTSGELSVAARLSDEQTMVSFDYPIAVLQQTWQTMKDQIPLEKLGSGQSQGAETFNKLNEIFGKFEFGNLAGIVSTPPSGSMPRAAAVLTSNKLSGDALLDELANSINTMVVLAQTQHGGTASDAAAAKVDKTGATHILKVQAGMIQVVGQLAGDHSVVFGLDPYFNAKIADKLKGPANIDYLVGRNPLVKSDLAKAAQVNYINFGVSIGMFKPWITTFVPPGANVLPEELDEVINLLNVGIIATQHFERTGDTMCTEAATFAG